MQVLKVVFFSILLITIQFSFAQKRGINWTADGMSYYKITEGTISKVDPKTDAQTVIIKKDQLIPTGASSPLKLDAF